MKFYDDLGQVGFTNFRFLTAHSHLVQLIPSKNSVCAPFVSCRSLSSCLLDHAPQITSEQTVEANNRTIDSPGFEVPLISEFFPVNVEPLAIFGERSKEDIDWAAV